MIKANYDRNSKYFKNVRWEHEETFLNNPNRTKVDDYYSSFEELYASIEELGRFTIRSEIANVVFSIAPDPFVGDIVAVRASGLNVSRILITKERFSFWSDPTEFYCRLLANEILGPELEINQIVELAEEIGIGDTRKLPDLGDEMDRFLVDLIAARRKIFFFEDFSKAQYDQPITDDFCELIFNAGFAAGRGFSEMQVQHTIETEAYQSINRGLESRIGGGRSSKGAKQKRISEYWFEIEKRSKAFPLISEQSIFNDAWESVCKSWGKKPAKQTREKYETSIRSDEPVKSSYQAIFLKNA